MTGFIVAGSSGVILVVFMLLLYVEEKRGSRIVLVGTRDAIDGLLVLVWKKWAYFSQQLGAGTVRATLHYFVYGFLSRAIRVLVRLQGFLSRLQVRNRESATTIRASRKKNHLDEIATYKEEHALSPEEKRRRKSHTHG